MATEKELREALCEVGRRVWQKGFVASNDGNFSVRLSENRVLCTPTMISKGFMQPDDLVIMDLDGNQISGRRKGTSEVRIHLFIYKNRPDVHSVVHVHPPHATAFTIAKRELPKCVLQEVELFIGEIPMAPYATTGTWDFARTIEPWVHRHDCLLLTNHGAVTVGQDPFDAYYKMETLDQYCRILLLARQLGDWQTIDMAGMSELLNLKRKLGIPDARTPEDCGVCVAGVPAPQLPEPTGRMHGYTPNNAPLTDTPKLPTSPFLVPNLPYSQPPQARPQAASIGDAELRQLVEEVVKRMADKPCNCH